MNPMQSPNTGVGRKLCPEGRNTPKLVVDGIYIELESLSRESIMKACNLMYGNDFGGLCTLTEDQIIDACILMYGEK